MTKMDYLLFFFLGNLSAGSLLCICHKHMWWEQWQEQHENKETLGKSTAIERDRKKKQTETPNLNKVLWKQNFLPNPEGKKGLNVS